MEVPLMPTGMPTGPLFLTINGRDENGVQNPWSVLIVEALQQHDGYNAIVLKSPAGRESIAQGTLVVPLYDFNFGINRWSPRPKNAPGTPGWAQTLSSSSCVAVGRRCVVSPEVAERAARQIATLFLRESSRNGGQYPWGEYPWGPAPSRVRSRRGLGVRPRPEARSHLAL